MIISFAWTTPAVALGEKCETRRDWSERTVRQFQKAAETGALVEAWDRSPRFGGKLFGHVRILEVVPGEDSRTIPLSSWEREGFHVLDLLGAKIAGSSPHDVWRFWLLENDQPQTVVRFELVSLNGYGRAIEAQSRAALEKLANGRGRPMTSAIIRLALAIESLALAIMRLCEVRGLAERVGAPSAPEEGRSVGMAETRPSERLRQVARRTREEARARAADAVRDDSPLGVEIDRVMGSEQLSPAVWRRAEGEEHDGQRGELRREAP